MAKLLSGTRIYGTATVDTQLIINGGIATSSTGSGSLQVFGGAGISGGVFVGGIVTATLFSGASTQVQTQIQTANASHYLTFVNTNNATAAGMSVYTTSSFAINPATGAIAFGGVSNYGLSGQILQSNGNATPTWVSLSGVASGSATTATNLASGTAGQVPYQTAPGLTSFISTATTGNFLQANYVGAPTWTTTGSMYVANAVTSTNLRAGTAGQLHYQSAADTTAFLGTATTGNFLQANYIGAPTWTTTGSMYVNSAVNAQNLYAGTAGQLVYQSAANTTAFLGTATTGNFLQANYIGAPTWTTTSSMQVGYAANILGVGTGGILYESANNTTSILSTGTSGQLLMAAGGAPIFTNTSSIYVNSAVNAQNLYGGVAGSIPMQTATGVTGFISTGTSGYVLTMGTNLASWQSLSGLASGSATTATNLAGGTAGQIPYQSAPGTTLFANSGTTGQFWQATTNGTPAWTTTASMYVGNSAIATNLRAGTAGQLHYQSGVDTSGFVGPGTAGQLLVSAGASAPVYTNTSSIYVQDANVSTNIRAGTAGQLVYQSAANTSGFVGPGTAGQILVSAGPSAPVYTNTASIYVGNSAKVDTVLQTANASYYPAFVSTNNATPASMSVYTTSSFYINPQTGGLTATTMTASSNAYNTATAASNAIYTSGGIYAGAGLTVAGPTLFKDTVTFSGTATYVYSTNTVYTDNIIEMHTPPGGVSALWYSDDGKDIGFRFHYYTNTTDTNAALVLANDTKYLEWYNTGAENTTSNFSSATYGTFKTGAIKLVGGTANSGNTSSGDLTVLGGVGIGGSMYVSGNITVAGTINASITGVSTTATNIAGGLANQIHYQTSPGITGFISTATTGNFLQATTNGTPAWTTTGSMYVNSAVNAQTLYAGTAGQLVYQSAANTTAFLGTATTGNFLQANYIGAPTWTTTGSMYVGNSAKVDTAAQPASANYYPTFVSTNNASAAAMSVYTTSSFVINPATGNVGIGTTNISSALLNLNPNLDPGTYPKGIIYATSNGVAGGTAAPQYGLHFDIRSYNNASSMTGIYSKVVQNTAGVSYGVWGESYGSATNSTYGVYGKSAQTDTNGSGVAYGVYGIGTSTIGVTNTGYAVGVYSLTNDYYKNINFVAESTYTGTNTQTVLQIIRNGSTIGSILSTATGILLNSAGSLTLQSNSTERMRITSAGGISFGASGTAYGTSGQILQSNGDAAPTWVSASGVTAGNATNIAGGTAGQLVYQSAANTTAFINTSTTGNFLQANYIGAPTWTTTASMYVANAVTSTNLRAGTAGQIHYQSAADTTAFLGTATTGNFLQANYIGAPTWTTTGSMYVGNSAKVDTVIQTANANYYPTFVSTNNATSASMSVYTTSSLTINPSNGKTTISAIFSTATTTASSIALQLYNLDATGTVSTASQVGIGFGQSSVRSAIIAGTWGNDYISFYTSGNLITPVVTLRSTGALAFNGQGNYGSTGQVLQSNGDTSPTWVSLSGVTAGNATTATNIAGGTAGQLHYQSAPGLTSFISTATTGNFLQATTNGAPTWTTTANIYVANAVIATNLRAGTAGQLHYQSAADTSGFVGPGTAGQLLVSAGASAPVYTNTASIYVQDSNVSTNIRAGTAGQLVYQSAANTTAFLGTATTGNFLQANYVGAPTWTTTGSMYVNRAVIADSASGGSSQVNTQIATANASYYPTFVDSNNASATAETVYTTSSFVINPATGLATHAVTNAGNTVELLRLSNPGAGASTQGQLTFYTASTLYGSISGGYGAAAPQMVFNLPSATTGNYIWQNNSVEQLRINTAGQVGVGSNYAGTGGSLFAVNGGVYVNGTVTATTFVGSFTGGVTGAASQVNTQIATANASYYPTFVDSNNASATAETVYTTSSFAINPSTGNIGVGTTSPNSKLDVRFAALTTSTQLNHILLQSLADGASNAVGARTGITFNNKIVDYVSSGGISTAGIYGINLDPSTFIYGRAMGLVFYTSAQDVAATEKLRITTNGGISFGTSGTAYGTSGQILQSNGDAAPTWVSASGVTAGNATNIAGGTAGQLVYQSAANTTAFINTSTTGNFLQANYIGAPTWTTTASMYVANAVTSTNLRAGTAGQIHYQSAADTTAFLGTATTGNFLQANYVGAPTWTTTGSMYVNRAVIADSASGGSSQVNTQIATANASYYPTFVDSNNASATAETVYTTSSFTINPATGNAIHTAVGQGINGLQVLNNSQYLHLRANMSVGSNNSLVQAGDTGIIYSNGTIATGAFVIVPWNGIQGGIRMDNSGTVSINYTGPQSGAQLSVNGGIYVNGTVTATTFVGSFTGGVTGAASQVNTQIATASANYFPTFVDSNNASATAETVYTTSSVYVNPASGTLTAGIFQATNNGNGTNFQVGDDVWIGDINVANTMRITGQQNTSNAYIVFGTSDNTALGRTGAGGLTYGGNLIIHAGNTGTAYVNRATIADSASGGSATATNIAGGTAGQIPYQSAPSTTLFANSGTTGQFWQATTNGAPAWTTTANIYVANAVIATNLRAGTAGQLHYQSAADTTAFLGTATTGNFLQANYIGAPTWTTTGSMYVYRATIADSASGGAGSVTNALTISTGLTGSPASTYNGSAAITITLNTATLMATSVNLASGTAGQLVYQSAANTSGFVGPGTAGQLLVSAGASAPVYTNTGSIYVQDSNVSTNIRAGTAGQLHYQSAANTTAFLGTATTGNFLQANYIGAPTWTTTGSMYVYRATIADSATGGAGSVTNALTISTGLTGSPSSTYNGSAAITVTLNTATLMATSINLASGTAGQLHYQSAANTSGFVGPGTAGQLLVSAGASAPVYTNTGSIYVYRATIADSATGGAGSVTNSVTFNNGGVGDASGTTYNGSTARTISYNTIGAPSTTGANASGNWGIYTQGIRQSDGTGWLTAASSIGTSGNRGADLAPNTYNYGIFSEFKNASLYSTSGNYSGLITYAPFLGTTASTGDPSYQLLFSPSGANATTTPSLKFRAGIDTTWGAWNTLLHSGNISGVTAGAASQVNTVAQTASASYYPTFVSTNNASAAAMSVYTTSSFYINPSTGNVNIGGTTTISQGTNGSNLILSAAASGAEGGQIDFYGTTGYDNFTIDNYAGTARLFSVGTSNKCITTFAGTYIDFQLGGTVSSTSQFKITHTASAVNYLNASGQAAGAWPTLSSQGSDTNIGMVFATKGTGGVTFASNLGAAWFYINSAVSAVNYLQVTGAATGAAPNLQAIGSDANVAMTFSTKGTFGYGFYTNSFAQQQFSIAHTASAVDYLQVTGSASGFPSLSAVGSSTNSTIVYQAKGTGGHSFNGNNILQFNIASTASAVNYLQVTGAATGNSPSLTAAGSDTNIGLLYSAKGTSGHSFFTGGNTQFLVAHTASAVNYMQVAGNSAGQSPYFLAAGSDTNITIGYNTKGTGAHVFQTNGGSNSQFVVAHTASAVNYLQVSGGATGVGASMSAQGSDANVYLNIYAKGTSPIYYSADSHYVRNLAGATQFLISNTASAVNYIQATGNITGSAPYFLAAGADTNIAFTVISKGTGEVQLVSGGAGAVASYTNGSVKQFAVAHTASAVNYVQVTGAVTALYPTISSQGSDTNITLQFTAKGTGAHLFATGGGYQVAVAHTASAVNYLSLTGSATGNAVSVAAAGSDTNIGINITPKGTGVVTVAGAFAATTKSFLIDHPTKPNMKLRYGSLEGPENGVYIRGRLKNNNTIELPDYWTGLVDPDSITVNLTPIGQHQTLYVEDIGDNKIIVGSNDLLNNTINCFYTVFAERKDVEKLLVEIDNIQEI